MNFHPTRSTQNPIGLIRTRFCPLTQFKPKLPRTTLHPFSLSLLSLIEKGCHEQETIMTNPKMPTPGTAESQLLSGRRLTSEFRRQPTNNPNSYEPRKRYESGLLPCMSILLIGTNQFSKICVMDVDKFFRKS